jgi:hypothetical protein
MNTRVKQITQSAHVPTEIIDFDYHHMICPQFSPTGKARSDPETGPEPDLSSQVDTINHFRPPPTYLSSLKAVPKIPAMCKLWGLLWGWALPKFNLTMTL